MVSLFEGPEPQVNPRDLMYIINDSIDVQKKMNAIARRPQRHGELRYNYTEEYQNLEILLNNYKAEYLATVSVLSPNEILYQQCLVQTEVRFLTRKIKSLDEYIDGIQSFGDVMYKEDNFYGEGLANAESHQKSGERIETISLKSYYSKFVDDLYKRQVNGASEDELYSTKSVDSLFEGFCQGALPNTDPAQ